MSGLNGNGQSKIASTIRSVFAFRVTNDQKMISVVELTWLFLITIASHLRDQIYSTADITAFCSHNLCNIYELLPEKKEMTEKC